MFLYQGLYQKSYNKVNIGINLVWISVCSQLLRLIPNAIIENTFNIVTCLIGIFGGVLTITVLYFIRNTFPRQLSDNELQAIEYAKIMTELNDIYFNPEQVLDDKQ